jgi:hypothetical protein
LSLRYGLITEKAERGFAVEWDRFPNRRSFFLRRRNQSFAKGRRLAKIVDFLRLTLQMHSQ